MKTLEAFVVKHEKPILNYGTVLFLIPVMVFAIMEDTVTSVSILGGYVAFGTVFSFLLFGEIRRDRRNRVAKQRKLA